MVSYDVLGDRGCIDDNLNTQILNIGDFKNQEDKIKCETAKATFDYLSSAMISNYPLLWDSEMDYDSVSSLIQKL